MGTIYHSVIIPTLNEEQSIERVLIRIPERIWQEGEVIVVDASTDRTSYISERCGAKVLNVKKRGKGYQLKAGVALSKGRIIVLMDGDGEHPPEYIPNLLKELQIGYDIVLGTRNYGAFIEKPIPGILYIFSQPFIVSLFRLAGLNLKGSPLTGFRCMWRETWNKIEPLSDNFLIESEMNLKIVEMGLRYKEVNIPYIERYNGALNSRVLNNGEGKYVIRYIVSYIFEKQVNWRKFFHFDNKKGLFKTKFK
jgi:glycosyltransferase involved in cell wall biosynthesis